MNITTWSENAELMFWIFKHSPNKFFFGVDIWDFKIYEASCQRERHETTISLV